MDIKTIILNMIHKKGAVKSADVVSEQACLGPMHSF